MQLSIPRSLAALGALATAVAPAHAGNTGACCFSQIASYLCVDGFTEADCINSGGDYQGDDTICATQIVTNMQSQATGVDLIMQLAVECPIGLVLACDPALPLAAATVTPPDGSTVVDFDAPGMCPIPPGFFDPGSEPFTGQIPLQGQPLGPTMFGDLGPADTLVLRSDDPFDRCDLPSPQVSMVEIQIVELNLQSLQPIQVIVQGQPTHWDVFVDLSQQPSPPGQIFATKTHCNGGTYDSVLPVLPRFTFTRTDDPAEVRVFDFAFEGCGEWVLQTGGAPWVHVPAPELFLPIPICTTFLPGLEETQPVTDPLLCVVVVPGDLDGDGNVGFLDLNLLLGAWGPCFGCPEDLDGDGNVGFLDLNILLGNWGQSCP